jgi:hypothetical protein
MTLRNTEVGEAFQSGKPAKNTNMTSDGRRLYSYGTVIAQWIDGRIIENVCKYSVSTSQHQSAAGGSRWGVSEGDEIAVGVPYGCDDLRPHIVTAFLANEPAEPLDLSILEAIGPAGEEEMRNTDRYYSTSNWQVLNEETGGLHHNYHYPGKFEMLEDETAGLMSVRHGPKQGGREAYLVVRDTTSGERHSLRVPPRFAWKIDKAKNQKEIDRAILEAQAWTFDMEPEDYILDREA